MFENNVTRINRITFDVVFDNDDEKQVVYEIEGADKATIALINDYNYHPKFGRVPKKGRGEIRFNYDKYSLLINDIPKEIADMSTQKYFKDKNTNKIYMKINDKLFLPVEQDNSLDLEEIDERIFDHHNYHLWHYEERIGSVNKIFNTRFGLKDIVGVPVGDKIIKFRVEHISNDKVYFVAVNLVGNSSMNDMEKFLDDFQNKMPYELVERMVVNEQKTVDGFIDNHRKVFIPSLANIGRDTKQKCCGVDDVCFLGLKTEAERCANDSNGETHWWWLSTPEYDGRDVVSATYFADVDTDGSAGYGTASDAHGVRPAFGINR